MRSSFPIGTSARGRSVAYAGVGGTRVMTGRLSVVVRWVRSVRRAASFSTLNWCRSRASAARLCTGVMIALASSLLTVSPVGAQACEHESVRRAAHAKPGSHATPAAVEQPLQHRAHSPAMHRASREDANTPVMPGPQVKSLHDCCGEGNGRNPPCPSSCPGGASCTTHGPVSALDAGRRVTAPAPVNSPEPYGVGEYPDSWSGSLDTPPPRS